MKIVKMFNEKVDVYGFSSRIAFHSRKSVA